MHSFGLKDIQHALASAAHDLVSGARTVATDSAKVQQFAPVIEGVTALVDPPAVVVEKAAFTALAALAKAANDTSDAGAAQGLNVQLDQETIEDFRQVYTTLMDVVKNKESQPTATSSTAS